MPETSSSKIADELREGTIEYLWRQWKAIGATVTSSAGPAQAIVDLEALILTSLALVPHERRLADIVWSWTTVNSQLVSIQRLKTLQRRFSPTVGQHLASLAGTHLRAKDARWKSLSTGLNDDLNERSTKQRATPPRFTSWATIQLQLRQGAGVGAKADVLTFILGLSSFRPEWASPSIIAKSVGYTPATVRQVLDDLAAARFIRLLDSADAVSTAQRMYGANVSGWSSLLGLTPHHVGWGYWIDRYRFLLDWIDWLDRDGSQQTGDYARNVSARSLLSRHRSALLRNGVVDPLEYSDTDVTPESLTNAARALLTWMANNG